MDDLSREDTVLRLRIAMQPQDVVTDRWVNGIRVKDHDQKYLSGRVRSRPATVPVWSRFGIDGLS
ncbi:hypothetical protein GALL_409800 [mine drainage metagenome]|uniref:Uncharacterized protein n=1 Tax=mine drainage metagenome TaxID=410659 RepID=A0A1J5Q206_9ZZZZ